MIRSSSIGQRLMAAVCGFAAMFAAVNSTEADVRAVSPVAAEIAVPADAAGVVRVPLSPEWLAAAGAGQATLRILDDNGTETPFVPAVQSGAQRAVRRVPLSITDYAAGDSAETLILRAEEGAGPLGALRFETRSRDFQRRVSLETSADGTGWEPLAEGLFFDLTQRFDFRRNRIEFSPTDAAWFRVRMEPARGRDSRGVDVQWGDRTISLHDFPGEAVPRVDRIVGETAATGAIPALWDRLLRTPVDVVTEGRTSEVDLGCPRLPVDRIALVTAAPAFSRVLRVETRGPSATDPHRQRMRTNIRRGPDDPPGPIIIEAAIDHFECGRLVIENSDDPPLPLETVRLEWHRREIVFIAAPYRTYTLYAGGRALTRPRYGLADVLSVSPADLASIPAVSVGPPEQNPAWDGHDTEPRPWTERHGSRLFAALLLVLTAAMALWIWRILRNSGPP